MIFYINSNHNQYKKLTFFILIIITSDLKNNFYIDVQKYRKDIL